MIRTYETLTEEVLLEDLLAMMQVMFPYLQATLTTDTASQTSFIQTTKWDFRLKVTWEYSRKVTSVWYGERTGKDGAYAYEGIMMGSRLSLRAGDNVASELIAFFSGIADKLWLLCSSSLIALSLGSRWEDAPRAQRLDFQYCECGCKCYTARYLNHSYSMDIALNGKKRFTVTGPGQVLVCRADTMDEAERLGEAHLTKALMEQS